MQKCLFEVLGPLHSTPLRLALGSAACICKCRQGFYGACAWVAQDFDDSFNDDDDDAAAYAEDVDMSDDWQLTGPDVGEDALEFITDYDAAGGMGDFTAAAQQQEPVLATAGGTGYGMPLSAPGSRGFQPSLLVRARMTLPARQGAARQPSCHAACPLLYTFKQIMPHALATHLDTSWCCCGQR